MSVFSQRQTIFQRNSALSYRSKWILKVEVLPTKPKTIAIVTTRNQMEYLQWAESWPRWAGERSKVKEANLESWGLERSLFQRHKYAEFNWTGCFLQEGRSVFGNARFGARGAQHNIFRGLWEKLFGGLSEGKMLFIFPGVLQKATWKVQWFLTNCQNLWGGSDAVRAFFSHLTQSFSTPPILTILTIKNHRIFFCYFKWPLFHCI